MSADVLDCDPHPGSLAELTTHQWQVVAAQKRGSRHEATGANCEDAYQVVQPAPGLLVVAVADGCGSAKFAEIGAWTAVQQGTTQVCAGLKAAGDAALDESTVVHILQEALAAALSAVQVEAATREVDCSELASTMILILANSQFVAAAHIGDGAVVVAEASEMFSLTIPAPGEYLNDAVFLTSKDALQTTQLKVWRGRASGVAAFSDGLQLLCLQWPECKPHAAFFKPLFEFVRNITNEAGRTEELASFLHSERIEKLTDDDVTLVLATLPSDDDCHVED